MSIGSLGSPGYIANTASEDNPFPVVSVTLKEARVETDTSFNKGTYDDTCITGTGQTAYLELDSSDATRDVPYTTAGNYTISDSDKLEVSGGYLQHIGTAVSGECLTFSRFDTAALDFSLNNGTLAITLDGSFASISSGELLVPAGGYALVNTTNNVTGLTTEGCVNIRFTPQYGGGATGAVYLYGLRENDNSTNHNKINLAHVNGTNWYLSIYNSSAVQIYQATMFDFDLTEDVESEIELSWKFTTDSSNTGEIYCYIDGVRKFVKTDLNDCLQDSHVYNHLGAVYSASPSGLDFKYNQIEVFDTIQHTGATYTPATEHAGYYITDDLYCDTKDTSQLSITTSLVSATQTATIPDGDIKYLLSTDGRTSWKRWSGSAWVTSSSPTARSDANSISDINTNIETLTTPSDILDVRSFIKTDSANNQTQLDLLRISVVSGYVTDGTYISAVYDSTYIDQNWGKIYFSSTSTSNTTLTVKVRASNDSSAMGSYGSALSNGAETNATGQYVQFELTLGTSDESDTPTINWVGIRFVPPIYQRDDV